MERIVHIAKNFKKADRYDRKQSFEMTPGQRIALGRNNPEIREWHRGKSA